MPDEILSRESIARDADMAAQRAAQYGVPQLNPHLSETDAHSLWQRTYEARLLVWSARRETLGAGMWEGAPEQLGLGAA